MWAKQQLFEGALTTWKAVDWLADRTHPGLQATIRVQSPWRAVPVSSAWGLCVPREAAVWCRVADPPGLQFSCTQTHVVCGRNSPNCCPPEEHWKGGKNKSQTCILLKHEDVLWKPKSGTKIAQFRFSLGSSLHTAMDGPRVTKYGRRSPIDLLQDSSPELGGGPRRVHTSGLAKPLAVLT